MVRARKDAPVANIVDLAKKIGFTPLDESNTGDVLDFLPTFIPAIDLLLSGGIPFKRMSEVYAPEKVGKSTFMIYLTRVASVLGLPIFWVDAEGTSGKHRMQDLGVDPSKVMLFNPESLGRDKDLTVEEVASEVEELIEAYIEHPEMDSNPMMVIWDSIGSTISQTEAETDFDKEGQRGRRAQAVTKLVNKITPKLNKVNVAFIAINQVRANQNMRSMYDDKWTRPGSEALNHWESLRIELRRGPKKTGRNHIADDSYVGHKLRLITKKNKQGLSEQEKDTYIFSEWVLREDPPLVLDGIDYPYAIYNDATDCDLINNKGAYKEYTTLKGETVHAYEKDIIIRLHEDDDLLTDMFTQCMIKRFPVTFPAAKNKNIDIAPWPYLTKELLAYYRGEGARPDKLITPSKPNTTKVAD